VEDHCRAVERVIVAGRVGETYNVGGQAERANLDVVRLLCTLLDELFAADPTLARRFPACPAGRSAGTASLITFVPDRPGHDRRYAMDSEKVERETGFKPGVGLEQGLRRTLAWYLEHDEWWRMIMDGSYREWMRKQYGTIVSF
jgi:dTDP-glucose 4,6-dehydratase